MKKILQINGKSKVRKVNTDISKLATIFKFWGENWEKISGFEMVGIVGG